MPNTPNHDYNVPNEGEQDWHVPLNENFKQFDADIEIRDVENNLLNYEPKKAAKFLAVDTGSIWIGDGSDWSYLRTSGPIPEFQQVYLYDGRTTPAQIMFGQERSSQYFLRHEANRFTIQNSSSDTCFSVTPNDPFVGIGMEKPTVPLDVRGRNNWNLDASDGDVTIGSKDYRLAMGVALGGGGAGACNIRAKGGVKRLNLGAGTNGHTVQVAPDKVSVDGDLNVSGNKNFTQTVNTNHGEREVVYTATEAGTPHTEASGVAELTDGCTKIDLPEHFGWVTDGDEPLHVQTTPHTVDSGGLAVVERSTERIVVEDRDGEGNYELSYTVKGTREGQADKQVVREPAVTTAPPSDAAQDATEPSQAD